MKRAIAEHAFDCVDPSGKRFSTVVRIGAPVDHRREGDLAEYSTCDVNMEPMIPPISVGGVDSLQALVPQASISCGPC